MKFVLSLLLVLSLAASACASQLKAVARAAQAAEELGDQTKRPALPADALGVPLHEQETDYSCGAAALLSVLRYWNVFSGKESDLYGPLGTDPRQGTEPPKLEQVARAMGLKAQLRKGMSVHDLREALARGETVIVDIQAWREGATANIPWEQDWEDGHYVVLIGIDRANAYFEDPVLDDAYAYIDLNELPRRWHDYEDRNGTVERYYQAGIVIGGGAPKPAPRPSKKPVRLK